MHGCGSLPSVTDGNLHPPLPRRLAHSGSVRGSFNIAQDPPPQPLMLPRAQGQLCQEHTITQPTSIVPGHSYRLNVTLACVSALACWRDLFWLKQGVILDMAHRRKVATTDASNKGWGALCEGKPTLCLWSEEEPGLHINCLEMLKCAMRCSTHRNTSERLKGNVLGYYRNLGSLGYGKEYCFPGHAMSCTSQSLLSKKSEMRPPPPSHWFVL